MCVLAGRWASEVRIWRRPSWSARAWCCWIATGVAGSARSTSSLPELVGGARTVVFCEVKCRTGLGFGDPLEAITYAKLRKLRQLAGEWLAASGRRPDAIRLDAVGVVMIPGQPPRLTHVRGIG